MATRLKVTDLKIGMVLAENLTSEDGAIILPAGKIINERDLEKLSNMDKVLFAIVEGDSILLDILEEETKTAPPEMVELVNRAFKYWKQDSEFLHEFKLLSIKYRLILTGLSSEE